MNKIVYDTIIISDIHFGSPNCQSKELYMFLDNIRVKELILNGDVFDDLNFWRLTHWDWQAFSQIRKVSDHCKVVWNKGNHDEINEMFMSALLGVHVNKGHYWKYNNKLFYATHGHVWDIFIYKYRKITEIATWIYTKIQYASHGWSRKISEWVKSKSKSMIRNCEVIRNHAVKMAEENAISYVFCGHTHSAEMKRVRRVLYVNSGTWESDVPHFIGINKEGIFLCRYENHKTTIESFEKF